MTREISNILVIHHDRAQLQLLTDILNQANYQAIGVTSAMDAWRELTETSQEAFSTVIMAENLPDLSARDLMAKIQSSAKISALPVIVMTGNAKHENVEHKICTDRKIHRLITEVHFKKEH